MATKRKKPAAGCINYKAIAEDLAWEAFNALSAFPALDPEGKLTREQESKLRFLGYALWDAIRAGVDPRKGLPGDYSRAPGRWRPQHEKRTT